MRRGSAALALTAVALLVPSVAPLGLPTGATASPNQARLPLIFPLAANDAGLERFAASVSTPGSPQYGDYQPVAVLARRFGAGAKARAAAVRYLRSVGASDVQVNATGMFVQATMSVHSAERTFATPLVRLRGGYLAPRAAPRRLPPGVLGVVGLDTRPLLTPNSASQPSSAYRPASGAPSGCGEAIGTGGFTPNQYVTAYDYAPLRAAGLRGQGQRVALIEIDGFKRSDIRTFAACFGRAVPPISLYGVGLSRPLAPGPEATLDLEMADAAAPRARSLEVFESGSDAVAVDQAFAAPLIAPGAKPQVISFSLGLCEPSMFAAFGTDGILSVERNLELAAAAGITTVVAAGDDGSADCTDRGGQPIDARAVDYPAASPWVTSVGGTNMRLDAGNRIASQVVWNDTTDEPAAGGGGLSGLFVRPRFQNGLVAPNRRALPDVSMLADVGPGYVMYCTARAPGCTGWRTVGGTSAAAPLLAGGLALVDQDLHGHHREFVGLANPLLYAIGRSAARPNVFTDVTQGNNDLGPFIPGSGGQPLGCCSAGTGFDWASGWGSVDLAQLAPIAVKTLPKIAGVSISFPHGQHPIATGGLTVRVSCTSRCTVYAFGFITITGGVALQLRSATHRLPGRGAKLIAFRFSPHQESVLRAALAHHRHAAAELFGAAIDARGAVGEVTPGRVFVII